MWSAADGMRVWRTPESDFYGDEPLQAIEVYTDQVLQTVAAQNFNAIWLRGRLRELVDTRVFPELVDPNRERRMDNLRALIERGRRNGVSVYIYFNEPLALAAADPFWERHPDTKGISSYDWAIGEKVSALCTSTPEVREYMGEGTRQLLSGLPDLGGVILITATEFLTHCWSHYVRYDLDDGCQQKSEGPLACPRCRDKEPATIVLELLDAWARAAAGLQPRPRIIAWNWSWSVWYRDPQEEVVGRLPKGIEFMADWERGGQVKRAGKDVMVDEYSLGYVGPGERFTFSMDFLKQTGTPVHAKLQLGTTHELATVPNLPLIPNLLRKFRGLDDLGAAGIMGCWNFGCSWTLNTFALKSYCDFGNEVSDDPKFLARLCKDYFGEVDDHAVLEAWDKFCHSFEEYPFSIRMLYWSPINYAPAYPLVSEYHARPMGLSFLDHEFGDHLEVCLSPFTLSEAAGAFARTAALWQEGLERYEEALAQVGGPTEEDRHRCKELSTARMIACHLHCMANIFRFHEWRTGIIKKEGLEPPCNVCLNEAAQEIIHNQINRAGEAFKLAEADPRLGFHQESHVYFCSPERIRKAIELMQQTLEENR